MVILSCDKYSFLWELSINRIKLHWPDFQGKKYLITNFLRPQFHNIQIIDVGEDKDWSSNLIYALSSIGEDYVFLIFEDSIINSRVNNLQFYEYFMFILKKIYFCPFL